MATGVKVTGLQAYLKPLKGKAFKDVNRELRSVSKKIATEILPEVTSAVRQSKAPQAGPMAGTARAKSDRVPVISVGAVNPRFTNSKFRRAGSSAAQSKLRRGAMAHGVVYGGKGGHRKGGGDFYKIPRDNSGGTLGKSLAHGRAMKKAQVAYLREYYKVLHHYGFTVGRP
jgi:hypothetical protein